MTDDLTTGLRNLAGSMVRNGHYDAGRHIASLAHGEPEPMARKPRIITETAATLRRLAEILDGLGATVYATDAREAADKLDEYDARETKKDPSQKRKAKRKAKSTSARAATR